MKGLPMYPEGGGLRLVRHVGLVAPLVAREIGDVDPLRYLVERREEPEFVLARERYRGATILISDRGFGIGEATWVRAGVPEALGIRVVIAPAFGPVFFSDALRQGVLLVPLTAEAIEAVAGWVDENSRGEITVDLEAERVEVPGLEPIAFETHPRLRERLLHGLSEAEETRRYGGEAAGFREAYARRMPWIGNRE